MGGHSVGAFRRESVGYGYSVAAAAVISAESGDALLPPITDGGAWRPKASIS